MRQRKLIQWAIAYLAGAWLALEAFGFVADRFGWPAGLVRGATILLGMGLLATLVLAWFHGEKGRQRVGGAEVALMAALAAGTGILLFLFAPTDSNGDATSAPLMPSVDSLADRSIAVLPFENRSGLEGDAYFTDGIHDEILTRLLNVSSLRVISRTSVMQYRNRSENLRTIGHELGTRFMLEGGVQRAGSRVRITAQLIDATDDRHLWAQSYDRELTVENLFAIQSEVATAIAVALEVNLSEPEQRGLASVHTTSLEAYNLFLQGRQLQNRFTEEALQQSVDLFQDAIRRDPEFARAHAALGESYMWFGHGFTSVRPLEVYPLARAAAHRALELDEESAEAHALLGHLVWEADRDPVAAERSLRRAVELSPSSSDAREILAWFLTQSGRFEEAQVEFGAAYTLDPLSSRAARNLAAPFRIGSQHDRAITLYLNALASHPDDWLAHLRLGRTYIAQERAHEALESLERAVALNPKSSRARASLGHALALAGQTDRARTLLAQLEAQAESGYVWPLGPAMIQVALGANHEALDWLERAYEERISQLMWLDRNYPELAPLSQDPRYLDIVSRVERPN